MADTKISALPSGAPAQAGDEYVIARSGANYKLTGTNLLGLVTGTANTFSADQTFGIADVTTLEASNLRALDGTPAATIANSTGVIAVSTKVEYADGTAAAPTVTNTGDTDTGVYFPAANEVAVSTGGTVAAAFNSNGLFFRNRIINGDMRIAQRGTAAVTTNDAFPVDRFRLSFANSTGAFSGQQDATAPAGFVNSLKYVTTTADATLGATEYAILYQAVEGTNVSDLAWGSADARSVTLSFWCRSSVTGTFGGTIRNSAANRSYVFSFVINSADTWEYKNIVIPGDTSGTWLTTTGVGMYVSVAMGAGATLSGTAGSWSGSSLVGVTGGVNLIATLNANFYVTGVQLETGSVATPFERRPYGTEFFLCQRYYQEVGAAADAAITYQAYAIGAGTYYLPMPLPVPMRAAPTGTIAGTWAASNLSSSSISAGVNAFRLNLTAAGAGNFSITNNGAGSKLTFAIEL